MNETVAEDRSTAEEAAAAPARGRRLLLVAAAEYDASVAKGVSPLLHDFDEKGFFEKVVMAFPFTRHNRVVPLGAGLVIHEYGMRGPRKLRQALGPFHLLRVITDVARLAKREGVAAIRGTDPCLCGIVALAAARLSGKPVCVSVHADFDKRHELDASAGAPRILGSRRLAIALERFVLSRADMVLPIRESLIGYVTSRGAPRHRIHVIPHGADLTAFTTPAAPGALAGLALPEGQRIVSFVGRLSRENYIDDVVEAARTLSRQRRDVVVAIAGDGAERARLETMVGGDADLARSVRFLGFQPRPVVAALRQASAVALCPMGGFSLIEACAAGAPVVAYDVEWHRELVVDGESGHLVPEGRSDRLAAAVAGLLDDPDGARRMGRNGRELALSRHDLDAAVAVKRRCYRLLVEGRAEE